MTPTGPALGPDIPVPLLLEIGDELGEGGLGPTSVYNHLTALQ